ncbi:sugar transferase [uncultured Croceitalea sp.]|uniref:sugar transferase n=1 Tax=uncultured Croceitalea sp. TaxID=1798908 RepID=UPI0033062FE7
MYKNVIKRILDLVLALALLVMLSPIIIIVSIILVVVNNGKPFYTQRRPGKSEKVFSILKFKTMNDKKDDKGNLLPDTYRLTGFGKFLRKTSIDEFPQLINVIWGDMSLVGPRPLLVRYLPYYTEEEKVRFTLRPGITGLAQVSGRNFLTWDNKLSKDIEYANNLSLKLDIEILWKTFWKTIKGSDVAVDQDAVPEMVALDEERKGDEKFNN